MSDVIENFMEILVKYYPNDKDLCFSLSGSGNFAYLKCYLDKHIDIGIEQKVIDIKFILCFCNIETSYLGQNCNRLTIRDGVEKYNYLVAKFDSITNLNTQKINSDFIDAIMIGNNIIINLLFYLQSNEKNFVVITTARYGCLELLKRILGKKSKN